jgi:hypothetical protein
VKLEEGRGCFGVCDGGWLAWSPHRAHPQDPYCTCSMLHSTWRNKSLRPPGAPPPPAEMRPACCCGGDSSTATICSRLGGSCAATSALRRRSRWGRSRACRRAT